VGTITTAFSQKSAGPHQEVPMDLLWPLLGFCPQSQKVHKKKSKSMSMVLMVVEGKVVFNDGLHGCFLKTPQNDDPFLSREKNHGVFWGNPPF